MRPKMKDLPIPSRMAKLPRDKRGYPIPYIVLIDEAGEPHFTINDQMKHYHAVTMKRCGLCGGPMTNGYWFIGGPKSAFHHYGAYIDGPVHKDCGTYALQVCPYLILSSYKTRIDEKQLERAKKNSPNMGIVGFMDNTMDPNHPPLFVMSKASAYTLTRPNPHQVYCVPKKPWREVQFWMDGEQISFEEGTEIVKIHDPENELILPGAERA